MMKKIKKGQIVKIDWKKTLYAQLPNYKDVGEVKGFAAEAENDRQVVIVGSFVKEGRDKQFKFSPAVLEDVKEPEPKQQPKRKPGPKPKGSNSNKKTNKNMGVKK